jgi:hypothetical protein
MLKINQPFNIARINQTLLDSTARRFWGDVTAKQSKRVSHFS